MVSKPTKPTNVMRDFTGGIKRDFDPDLKVNGFQENVKQILQGDNLNYLLDSLGRELTYIRTVVDYIRDINPYKIPYVDSNNNLVEADINTLLPTQTGNSGKFLTTNGTTSSWSLGSSRIGDPLFTLDFRTTGGINDIVASNYTDLINNNKSYIWLDGTQYDIPTQNTDLLYEIYQIYGVTYGGSVASGKFNVPNFTNCTIWGGTTAGKVEAGLPNITGSFSGVGQYYSNSSHSSGATLSGAFYRINTTNRPTQGVEISNDGQRDDYFGFDASKNYNTNGTYTETLYGKSTTVQPPAIKVRAYTRVR